MPGQLPMTSHACMLSAQSNVWLLKGSREVYQSIHSAVAICVVPLLQRAFAYEVSLQTHANGCCESAEARGRGGSCLARLQGWTARHTSNSTHQYTWHAALGGAPMSVTQSARPFKGKHCECVWWHQKLRSPSTRVAVFPARRGLHSLLVL